MRIAIAKDDNTFFIPNGLQKIVRLALETGKAVDTIELPNGTDFYALSLSPDSRMLAMWSPKHVARIGLDGGGYRELYIPAGNRSSTQVGTGNVAWTR